VLSNDLTAGLNKAVDLTYREAEKHIGDWQKGQVRMHLCHFCLRLLLLPQLELKIGLADLLSDMSAASEVHLSIYHP